MELIVYTCAKDQMMTLLEIWEILTSMHNSKWHLPTWVLFTGVGSQITLKDSIMIDVNFGNKLFSLHVHLLNYVIKIASYDQEISL